MTNDKCQRVVVGLTRVLAKVFRSQTAVRMTASVVFTATTLSAIAQDAKPVRILTIGDSTMASYARPPADRPDLTGWGQVFGEQFVAGVEVINKARSGRSSKSFLSEGAWDDAVKNKADYVFIQFGHNDQPGKGERATDPEGDFRDNLRRYIKDARGKGIQPILVTPVARRTYANGKVTSTLGPYVAAVIAVGQEETVPVIDLHAASMALFDQLGDAGSANLSASASDRTHFSRKGAETIAGLVAEQVRESVPDLNGLLKPGDAGDDSMAELIRAVEEQEQRYQNLETTFRREVQYDPKKWKIAVRRETIHTIRQPDRLSVKGKSVDEFGDGRQAERRFESVFDGMNSTVVEFGNSANVFQGYYEPSQVFPPHTWGMFHLEVNFPLSVFLTGTEALKTHPKVRQIPIERGSVFEFYRVDCERAGTETVGGFECEKIRVRRWYYTNDREQIWYVWLAPERNYLCVRSAMTTKIKDKEVISGMAFVTDFREIGDDLWLPERVDVTNFDYEWLNEGKRVPRSTEQFVLESARLNPDYGDDQFQLTIPDEMPVYRIENERLVDSPGHPQPVTPAKSTTLEEIITAIKKSEAEFENCQIRLVEKTRSFSGDNEVADGNFTSMTNSTTTHRSVRVGEQMFARADRVSFDLENNAHAYSSLQAYDGKWLRSVSLTQSQTGGELAVSQASLTEGGGEDIRIVRPHTILFDSDDLLLSKFLASEWSDEHNGYRHTVVYEGDERIDGLLCHKLRRDLPLGRNEEFYLSHYIWIARDRHYLPVKTQWLERGWHKTLPSGNHLVEEWMSPAPGIQVPAKWFSCAFKRFSRDGVSEGRLIHNWQKTFEVSEFTLAPQVDEELFTTVFVPKGTPVFLRAADGNSLGRIEQPADGNLDIEPDRWNELRATAEKSRAEQARIKAVMDALIGKPAPAFPEGTWLGGEPLSWDDLKGKVVVLDFWARWCGPCVSGLEQLSKLHQLYDNHQVKDRAIIGIHTAEVNLETVKTAIEKHEIGYPVYVDLAPEKGCGWGRLYDAFGVESLPMAIVIDREGKVAAYGRLEEMLTKAGEIADGKEKTENERE